MIFKKISQYRFEINSLILFLISMITNIINYVYQIAMGNMLTAAQFGTLNALLSLFTLLCVVPGILRLAASRYVAHYVALQEENKIPKFLRRLCQLGAVLCIGMLIVAVFAAPLLAQTLQVSKNYIYFTFLIAAATCFLFPFTGTLQGLKRFAAFSANDLISAACKISFSTLFIALGFQIFGSLWALLISILSGILFAVFALRKDLQKVCDTSVLLNRHEIIRYLKIALQIQIITTIFSNGDVLLIKAFSTNEEAVGLYASAMTLEKIPLYVSSAIVAVLFPTVAAQQAVGRDTKKTFMRAVLYGGAISVLSSVALVLVGKPVLSLLFGERYAASAELLLPAGCFMVPLTLVNLLMNYLTALGKSSFLIKTLWAGLFGIIALVTVFHSSTAQILYVMGSVLFAVALTNFVMIFALSHSQ